MSNKNIIGKNVKINIDLKHCKCDGCDGDGFYYDWPAGWIRTGISKFGNKYDSNGIAWWCPNCRKKYERAYKFNSNG